MTILASDTFIHPNQSGWPVPWSSVRGSGTYSISSNEGNNSANGGTFSIARLGSGTAGATNICVRVSPADTTSAIGTVARFQDMNNFYYGILSGGSVLIGRNVSGSFLTLLSENFSYASGTFYWLCFNLVGTNFNLKAWQDGTNEPGWMVTTTDSSFASGGFGLGSDATGITQFDHLIVTDASHLLICDGYGGVFS